MTKATLTIEMPDGDPLVADFDITDPDEKVTIVLTSTGVEINTPTEPRLVTS